MNLHNKKTPSNKIWKIGLAMMLILLLSMPYTIQAKTASQTTGTPTATPTCLPGTQVAPPRVEPVISPTDQLSQVITATVGATSDSATVTSESGEFTVTGNFTSGSPIQINISLLPDTTHHLTVAVHIKGGGCLLSYTVSTTRDKNGNPLTIVQGTGGGPTATPTLTPPPPTNTPTRTPTRTATGPTPTRTRTRTPTRTPTGNVPTNTPTRTNTPATIVPTNTPTRTPTPGSGICSPVTATITYPFVFEGAGDFCWKAATLPGSINSWNLSKLTINGKDYTNRYVILIYDPPPEPIDGWYYIHYVSLYAWGHLEMYP